MKRLTFDGIFLGIDIQSQRLIWNRLKAIEDILGDNYDLGELRQVMGYRSLIGKTVYCIRRRTPERNGLYGRTRPHDSLIATPGALKIFPEELYVAEKVCVQSDLKKLGVLIFLTREDAEAAIGGGQHV